MVSLFILTKNYMNTLIIPEIFSLMFSFENHFELDLVDSLSFYYYLFPFISFISIFEERFIF